MLREEMTAAQLGNMTIAITVAVLGASFLIWLIVRSLLRRQDPRTKGKDPRDSSS